MRRIALAAALAATLAGGAAALAATPDPGTPDAAPPDPYQGAWALAIDGRYAGAIAQVQGCGVAAQLVRDQSGGKHLAQPAPEECTFQAGPGMTPGFDNLVNDGLAGVPATHAIELIRTDSGGRYGLELDHARLSSVTLPKIERAGMAPVSLEVGIDGERITRDPSPAVTIPKLVHPNVPYAPQLKVSVAGQDLGASAVGPWTAEIKTADATGITREALPASVDIGDLPLRVPEASKAMSRVLDPWVRGAITDGKPDVEQPVTLTFGDLSLTLDHAAPRRADLVARADGARTYSLYAEHATVTVN